MTAKIIAFANQKGGVGKTTCCINLAAAVAKLNSKVLLIDLDPQGNATMGSGLNKLELEYTIGDILQEKIQIHQGINHTKWFDVIPSNIELTEAEINLIHANQKQFKLTNALNLIKDNYDLIFIDCPPSLNILTVNALIAANAIIIPLQCEYYALEGLSALISTIEGIRNLNPCIYIEGIIRTMYDPRNKLCRDVSSQLLEHFSKVVYTTTIPRNVRLAETPSHGMPILEYDRNSTGAKSYIKLAKEFLIKLERTDANIVTTSKELA